MNITPKKPLNTLNYVTVTTPDILHVTDYLGENGFQSISEATAFQTLEQEGETPGGPPSLILTDYSFQDWLLLLTFPFLPWGEN